MSKKLQLKVTNFNNNDKKKIENLLNTEFKNEIRNFYHQKDKRNKLTIYFSIKNDIILLLKVQEFFNKTNWKLENN